VPAALRVQVYYSVFDLDERYWVYNYNLFYRCAALAV
jgi:hypothetical protein